MKDKIFDHKEVKTIYYPNSKKSCPNVRTSSSSSLVFLLPRSPGTEDLSEVAQQPSAVEESPGVVGGGAAESVGRGGGVAVLADVPPTFVPLVGGLVDQSQVEVEEGVPRQEEEDEDDEAQHEDDSGEREEKMLEEQRRENEGNVRPGAQLHLQPYLDDEEKPGRLLLAVLVDVAGPQEPRAQHGVEQHVRRQHGHVGRHGAHGEQVQQEVARVPSAHAVVHPNAVVVEAVDASVADACADGRRSGVTLGDLNIYIYDFKSPKFMTFSCKAKYK